MKIKKITSQNRRDFEAILECEHCNSIQKLEGGYDDSYYHNNVIPNIKCENCGKIADETYRPLTTKYPDGMNI
jgi:transcription elongation factor Elf1